MDAIPSKERFIDFCLGNHSEDLKKLDSEIWEYIVKINDLEKELLQKPVGTVSRAMRKLFGGKKSEMRFLQERIRSLRNKQQEVRAMSGFGGQWDAFLQIPRVLAVDFVETSLVVHTDTLYGKSSADAWHRVGRFRITADLNMQHPDQVRWHNLDGTVNGMNGPTRINEEGKCTCLGNAKEPLEEALANHDYVTFVSVLVRFPECPGQQGTIAQWPKAEPEEIPFWYQERFG